VAVEFNIDGQPYRFPDWASESTQQQLRDILKELAKSQGVSEAQLQKILKAQEEALSELVDSNKEEKKNVDEKKKADKKILDKLDDMVEGLDEVRDATQEIKVEVPKSFRDKLADTLERDGEYLGGALLGVAGTAVKVGGVIGGAIN
jgi:Fic family protein